MLHYSVAYDTIRMRCGQPPNTRKYKRYPAILASPMKSTTNSFAKTRRDHAAETAEDYVEAIDDIQNSKGECRVRDLANQMQVSHVTVTRIISRLENEELVERVPYGPMSLTAAGKAMAKNSRKRHELMRDFLVTIGVPKETADHDAEGMEHHVSERTLTAIRKFLKNQ